MFGLKRIFREACYSTPYCGSFFFTSSSSVPAPAPSCNSLHLISLSLHFTTVRFASLLLGTDYGSEGGSACFASVFFYDRLAMVFPFQTRAQNMDQKCVTSVRFHRLGVSAPNWGAENGSEGRSAYSDPVHFNRPAIVNMDQKGVLRTLSICALIGQQ